MRDPLLYEQMKGNLPKNMNTQKKKKNNQPKSKAISFSGVKQVSAPATTSIQMTTMEPKVTRTNRSMKIAHRELVLASIAGSTGFKVQNNLALNPGLLATFPWMAPQAIQWEQYRCNKLVAWYVPIASSSTQGDVIISPNYDASDTQPQTEAQAANNYGTVIGPCWQTFCVELDPKAMMGLGPRKFVRQCLTLGDPKTFDLGTLAICSNNETGTSAIGKLFLEYEMEFYIPQNDPSTQAASLGTAFFGTTGVTSFTTGVGNANISWNNLLTNDPFNFGSGIASGVFTPPQGTYLIRCTASCQDTSAEAFLGLLHLQKNSADIVPAANAVFNVSSSIANVNQSFMAMGIFSFNGTTDTFRVLITLTGAAGTLTIPAGQIQLIISLA